MSTQDDTSMLNLVGILFLFNQCSCLERPGRSAKHWWKKVPLNSERPHLAICQVVDDRLVLPRDVRAQFTTDAIWGNEWRICMTLAKPGLWRLGRVRFHRPRIRLLNAEDTIQFIPNRRTGHLQAEGEAW